MARKPKKPAPRKAPTRSAPRRAPAAAPVDHRLVVASVGLAVSYAKGRVQHFELSGAAIANSSLPDGGTRISGLVRLGRKKGGKGSDSAAYDPASLDRNLVLTLFVDDDDFALFRDVFVRNPGGYDPGIRLWARTARPFDTATAASQPVIAFGYSLDLVQTPAVRADARSPARTFLGGNPRPHAAEGGGRSVDAGHRRPGRRWPRLRGRQGLRHAAPSGAHRSRHAGALARPARRAARARASARRRRRSKASCAAPAWPRSRRRASSRTRRAISTSP